MILMNYQQLKYINIHLQVIYCLHIVHLIMQKVNWNIREAMIVCKCFGKKYKNKKKMIPLTDEENESYEN